MDRKSPLLLLGALIGLSLTVQVGLIVRAAVPSQDAVRFVRFAKQIAGDGLVDTLRTEGQQPLFPVTVWLVHEGLEGVMGPFPSAWARSAQVAAAVPLVLAVVPVFFIALRLVGPRGAVAGAVLFAVLPEVSRLGPNGLSDSTHLFFFALAFWGVTEYWRVRGSGGGVQKAGFRVQNSVSELCRSVSGSPWLLLAGVATAAALLSRAEAIVLPLALMVSLLVFHVRTGRGAHRLQPVVAMACFLLGFGLLFAPYLAVVQASTPRAAVARVLGRFQPSDDPADKATPAVATSDAVWRLADGEPMSFAYKEHSISLRRRGIGPAVAMLAEELADAFGYGVGVFALIGVWRLRSTPVRRLDRFAQIFFLLYVLAVVYHGAGEGYLSARHLVPLVAVLVGCAGHGLTEGARWVLGRRVRGSGGRVQSFAFARQIAGGSVVGLVVATCLATAAEPLHNNRRPHRNAGEWLAHEAIQPGPVLDTRGFTGLYSGRATYGYDDAWTAFCDTRLAYVVLEARELSYESERSRTLKVLLDAAAEPAATFLEGPAQTSGSREVLVYRWSGERFLQWLAARESLMRDKVDATASPRVCAHRGGNL